SGCVPQVRAPPARGHSHPAVRARYVLAAVRSAGRRGRVASPRRSIAPTHRSMARSEALMRAHAPAVRSTGRSEGRRGLPPLLAALAATLWLVSSSVCASSAPTRIVSLNPCLDGLLVELVPHERIAAISHYSR